MRCVVTDGTTVIFRVHYGSGYADCTSLDNARHLADLLENQSVGEIWLELIVQS